MWIRNPKKGRSVLQFSARGLSEVTSLQLMKSLQEGLPWNTPGARSSSHAHASQSALGFLMEHRSEVLGQ